MTLGQYLLGLLLLGITVGACLLSARIVVRRRLAPLPGHARGAALGVLLATALLAVTLVPAALGLLGRGSAPICALALLAAVNAFVRPSSARSQSSPAPDEPRLSGLLGAGAILFLAGWTLASAWLGSAIPSEGPDTLDFHLPEVVRWMQTSTIWRVDQFEPLLANAYYPQNGDVLSLAVMVPFQSEALVRVLSALSLPMVALAVYALARELRAPPTAAALGAALLASLPISVLTAEEGAKTDLWCIAALAVAGLFLIRNLRTGARADLLLGSLALGLGFGTKWYGATAAVVLAAAWAVARPWPPRRARGVLRDSAALAGLCALGGGLWLVRNWVESGNPLFPAPVEVAGLTLFGAPADPVRECADFSVADYAGDADVLRHILWPIWKSALGAGAVMLLAAFVAAPLLSRPRRSMVALTLVGLALLVMYAVLPYGALGGEGQPVLAAPNTRYALPALAVAAALFACALPRLGRFRHAVELITVLAMVDGLRRGVLVGEGWLAAGVAGALALGTVAVFARRVPRRTVTVAIAMAALAVATIGFVRQREFYDGRYQGADPALDVLSSTPEGTPVGLAGFESAGLPHVLPAFGRNLGNVVTYVGEDDRGQLRVYERSDRFASALADGRFEYLLVARAEYAVSCALPGESADPGGWAEAAGWRRLTETPALTLYRRP